MLTEGLKAVNDEDEDKEDGDGDDFLDEYGNLKSDSEGKSKGRVQKKKSKNMMEISI